MAKYEQEVRDILDAIGGEENVDKVTHCVTRLRFALKDESKVDADKLESLDIVKGQFSSGGQFQVIIGQGTVDQVYRDIMELTDLGEASKDEVKEASAKKMNPLQQFVKVLADIFIPILPAIVTAGLLLGVHNLLTGENIFFDDAGLVDVYTQWADFADIIFVIANAAFAFLPPLIAWSAVKRFGGSDLFGIVLGLILVHPNLLSAFEYAGAQADGEVPVWNLFGLEIEAIGYQGQVLPTLVASWILAKSELWLRKKTPDAIQLLVVAPAALLFTGLVTFIIIGPITFTIGTSITDFFVWLFDVTPALGGLVYGIAYAPLVVTGMHHVFLAVDLQLTGAGQGTFLWPILALSNMAQGSAALAMMFLAKNENLRGLSGTSALSAYLGVTEPAMFGVNIRYRFPFVMAIIGAASAGMFISINNVLAAAVGVGGVPAIFSIFPEDWGPFFIGMLIALIVPLVLTYLYGKMISKEEI
ncbi:PTS system trehalose-specific EIIBC component [Salisediminibacterium halotolerans]|uniref:PTS system, trehalose-specific IIC component n=1 Tax=Salisediminibacterium halotolerans TaxID=517425 RepID=A0A1H9TJ67_9BACI|nr:MULTISPECIES: PTS system trehalose-specific EIIBC component [Salisediminibacterium]RLJ72369.1 PTS system trehalose-specific IIB component (Glc family) /PTS system trehalose-specific IIC component (Glc family) [Actinophytocola xinjiangensis]RPE85584.1 PTS system trehalose-specific IIB component (Glc family) /PTS system trehalose-specific IIC component (Glc family) [Salisediminibacterium halotolerans]TWG33538.1 PTS system trehalose-specific IIB component (Glc family) /PTS system trehalose-speci